MNNERAENPLFAQIRQRRLIARVARTAGASEMTVAKLVKGGVVENEVAVRILKAIGTVLGEVREAEEEAKRRAGLQ